MTEHTKPWRRRARTIAVAAIVNGSREQDRLENEATAWLDIELKNVMQA